jgi:ribosomal protein S27AE
VRILKKVIVTKMKCPKCGTGMNFHAEKIVYGPSTDSSESETDWFNASLQEFHACPQCGAAGWRKVAG